MAIKQCQNLDEVRAQIDDIDERLVRLLAQRVEYVRQAAKFKKSAEEVKAPARVEAVLAKVRNLAKINGVDPDFVEGIYRVLIDRLIEPEQNNFSKE